MSITKYTVIRFSLVISLAIAVGLVIVIGDIASSSLPIFPIPNSSYRSATLMGGWLLCIPETSGNKDLAWELITLVLDPKNNDTFARKIQPTQIPMEKVLILHNWSKQFRTMINWSPWWQLLALGPVYQSIFHIAEDIHQAVDQVFYKVKEPKQALDDAAAESAKAMGW